MLHWGASSKQQDGEKQVGQDGGEVSSNLGEAWQARQEKEQAASKMVETQASSKRGKMGEAVSSNAG